MSLPFLTPQGVPMNAFYLSCVAAIAAVVAPIPVLDNGEADRLAIVQDRVSVKAADQAGPEGGAAQVVLQAPEKARIGELVRFDLTKSTADSVKWVVSPGSKDFETYAEGRRAVFSARVPGEYLFIIAVASGGTVDVIQHTVRVEGPPMKPDSNSFSDWLPYWLYPVDPPAAEIERLANSFEAISNQITSLSTPQGIIEATGKANREVLGDKLDFWKPILIKIQVNLTNRAKSGELKTPEQHKTVWLEIAAGLRRYIH